MKDEEIDVLSAAVFRNLPDVRASTNVYDAHERIERTISASVDTLIVAVDKLLEPKNKYISHSTLLHWNSTAISDMNKLYADHHAAFLKNQPTSAYLGVAAKRIYNFVRHDLGVPFFRGLVEHPSLESTDDNMIDGREKKTIGSWVGMIYEAIRDQRVAGVVTGLVKETFETGEQAEEQH